MNKLIESVVNKVILEYCGVSDEIMDISSKILQLIFEQEKWERWKQSETYLYPNGQYGYTKSFYLDTQEGLGINNIVNNVFIKFYGYNSNKHSFAEMKEYLNEKGLLSIGYSPSKEMIIIKIPFPYKGSLDDFGRQYLLTSINHECKHALQSVRRGGTNISQAYQNATKWDNNFGKSDEASIYLMKVYIKRCYYMFDLDEVDARLQEIYLELSENGDLTKCNTYNDMQNALKSYKWLYTLMYDEDKFYAKFYEDERKIFQQILTDMLGEGVTTKQFFAYCAKGVRRYKEHLRRVVGRWQEENDKYNGSFKQYASNEIPQEYAFKLNQIKRTNPSLWRKLIQKLKFR